MNIFRSKILTKLLLIKKARNTILFTRWLQPLRDDCTFWVQKFSSVELCMLQYYEMCLLSLCYKCSEWRMNNISSRKYVDLFCFYPWFHGPFFQNVCMETLIDSFITTMFLTIQLRKWIPTLLFVSSAIVAVIHCLNVAQIVCGSFVLGPCFVMQYFECVSFLVLQSSRWGRKIWLLHFFSSWWHVAVIEFCLFPMVTCVGLQYVIVVFPGHTRLLLSTSKEVIGFRKSETGSGKCNFTCEKLSFFIFSHVKYDSFQINNILNQYYPVFYYILYNKWWYIAPRRATS